MSKLNTKCVGGSLLPTPALALLLGLVVGIAAADTTAISVGDASVTAGSAGGILEFPIQRSGDLGADLIFGYRTADGSATAPGDYATNNGTLTFAANNGGLLGSILVTVSSGSGPDKTMRVLYDALGVGPEPAFAAPQTFSTGAGPQHAAVADFNNDGRRDILVANGGENTVSVLLNTTNPGAEAASFTRQDVGVATTPLAVATGDFNGDGLADAVITGADGTVSVMLNATAPGAAAPSLNLASPPYTVGGRPTVAIDDWSGDGRPDIVVGIDVVDEVRVLVNNTPVGSDIYGVAFTDGGTLFSGCAAQAIALGELNGDGRLDVAAACLHSQELRAQLNGGSAETFAVRTGEPGPQSMTLADFNRDGRPDLAATGTSSEPVGVSVLLNTTAPDAATPAFAGEALLIWEDDAGPQPTPGRVAAADLNGDGAPELLLSGQGTGIGIARNLTAPAAATPRFAREPQRFGSGVKAGFTAAADFNNDGKPDLLAVDSAASQVAVLLNTTPAPAAAFGLAAAQPFAAGSNQISVAAGDLNGDGRPDLAVVNSAIPGSLSVRLNTATPGAITPAFATTQNFAAGDIPAAVAIADLNNDGKPDLLAPATDASSGLKVVSVLLNQTPPGAASASFAPKQSVVLGDGFAVAAAASDLNGDGRPDLAVLIDTQSGGVTGGVLRFNTTAPGASTVSFNGGGSPPPPAPPPCESPPCAPPPPPAPATGFDPGRHVNSLILADLNGDGRLDVLGASTAFGFIGEPGGVSVLRNTIAPGTPAPSGSSLAARQEFHTSARPRSLVAADLDGDGRLDVATANSDGSVTLLRNTTQPGATSISFDTPADFPAGAALRAGTRQAIAANDVNGDGRADLLVASGDDKVIVLLNLGGSFAAPLTFAAGAPFAVTTADFNLDGMPDVAVANAGSSDAAVLLNTQYQAVFGTGEATGTIRYPAPDTTPDSFSFTDQTGVARKTLLTSNTITVSGINVPAPISVSGASSRGYSIGCTGTFTHVSSTIGNGQTVCVRHRTDGGFKVATRTTLTIGGVSDTFTTTTEALDTTPDSFTFNDLTGVTAGAVQTSNSVPINGINGRTPIKVSGGSYSIGCTARFITRQGVISNGQTVCVRHKASAAPGTTVNTTLSIGGVADTFSSTTVP